MKFVEILKKAFTENIWLKITALVIAAVATIVMHMAV